MRYWKKESGGGGGITPEMFGGTKMEVCTWISTTSSLISSTTIGHSLGKAPFLVMMFTKDIDNFGNDMYIPFFISWQGLNGVPNTNALNYSSSAAAYAKTSEGYVTVGDTENRMTFTANENTITFDSSYSSPAYSRNGAVYYLILVA